MDEPRGVGRPAYQPTEAGKQIVRVLKANRIGERTIASELGINRQTLRKHYRTELRDGFERVKAALSAVIVREGLAGNVAAARFWLSARCPEWRVVEGREISLPPVDAGLVSRAVWPVIGEDGRIRRPGEGGDDG